jgi:hypothetical protein
VEPGDEPPAASEYVDIVDWEHLYSHDPDDEAVIDGIAYRGRWTAIASPAKAGKSTVLLALAVDAARRGVITLYLDAEMGRGDILSRLEDWMDLKPPDLANLHYSDLPPKLDNVQGATRLWNTVEKLSPELVIIDGLNGVVNGAENDDTTWRDMYEWAIAPLKQRGVAIVSADNLGKNGALGPRGSSVKLDKADAVLAMARTDTGVKLTATHRRTASYPTEQEYAVTGADECDPPMSVVRVGVGTGYPEETAAVVAILDALGAPVDISKRKARLLLKANGHDAPGDSKLLPILRYRREHDASLCITQSEEVVPSGSRTTQVVPEPLQSTPAKVVPEPPRNHLEPPPESGSSTLEPLSQNTSVRVVPAGGVYFSTTPPAPVPKTPEPLVPPLTFDDIL